jgi:hypothetical protein
VRGPWNVKVVRQCLAGATAHLNHVVLLRVTFSYYPNLNLCPYILVFSLGSLGLSTRHNNGSARITLLSMSSGYDAPRTPSKYSSFESRRASGNMPVDYDVRITCL